MAFVAYLALVPLGFLLWQSFLTPQTAATPARFHARQLRHRLRQRRDVAAVLDFDRVRRRHRRLLAFVLGTSLAWMNERTNTPFKSLFFALVAHPAGHSRRSCSRSPGSCSPARRSASSTWCCRSCSAPRTVFVDIYSMGGMIWVDGLHYSPMAFLLMTAAFRAMDPSLEESATMSGANVFQVAWRMTLKLTWPAIFADAPDPVRARDRVVRGAGAARPAGRHRGVHLVDLPGGAPLPEPDRPRFGLRHDAAGDHDASASTVPVAPLEPGSKYATMTGKGFRPRADRSRPLALVHGRGLRRSTSS